MVDPESINEYNSTNMLRIPTVIISFLAVVQLVLACVSLIHFQYLSIISFTGWLGFSVYLSYRNDLTTESSRKDLIDYLLVAYSYLVKHKGPEHLESWLPAHLKLSYVQKTCRRLKLSKVLSHF